jgi:hypothetical protein
LAGEFRSGTSWDNKLMTEISWEGRRKTFGVNWTGRSTSYTRNSAHHRLHRMHRQPPLPSIFVTINVLSRCMLFEIDVSFDQQSNAS